jgi:predicted NBD/HSP70 family sugar kinase
MADKHSFYFSEPMHRKNFYDVLNLIGAKDQPTRASIARALGLSRTTLSNIVSDFIDSGLIVETGESEKKRGRPATHLSIVADSWYTIGAEFHSGRWVFLIIDLTATIKNTLVMNLDEMTSECFIETFLRGLRSILSLVSGRMLPAIGIGVPGQVDNQRGVIIQAADLGWVNINLKSKIEAEFGFKTFVVNRNHASGFAESRYGTESEKRNMIYIGIGTGISSAIILNRTLLKGSGYSAGEIGHIVVDPDGPRCNCGKRGCLHTLASEEALVGYAKANLKKLIKNKTMDKNSPLAILLSQSGELTGEGLVNCAARGDLAAIIALETGGSYLGKVIASMINILNPDKVVIGGPIGNMGEPLLSIIKKESARWALDVAMTNTVFETGILGEFSGALGAGCLVLERKLELIYSAGEISDNQETGS